MKKDIHYECPLCYLGIIVNSYGCIQGHKTATGATCTTSGQPIDIAIKLSGTDKPRRGGDAA